MSGQPADRLELARWEAHRHAAVLAEALAAWGRLAEYPYAPAQRLAQLQSAIGSAAELLQAYRDWVARLARLSP